MNENLQVDCDLSHAVINYLNALFRGKFAALNALKQFSHRDFSQDEFSRLEKSIETISRWQQDLWKRMPLLSLRWTMPETFEAKRGFDLLSEIKRDLTDKITRYEQILGIDELVRSIEDQQLLITGYVRFAYGKDNYLKGFIEYGRSFGRSDMIDIYSQQLVESSKDLHLANWLIKEFRRRDQLNPDYERSFHTATYLLPHNLRMNLHDISQFLAIYDSEFSYENAEISRVDAQRWLQAGMGPKDAGYWNAFRFSPEEAINWQNAGFSDPALAGRWKYSGFSLEDAVDWQNGGLIPEIAQYWRKAGYVLSETLTFIKQGSDYPPNKPGN